jgi:hypothetical protein
VRDNGTSNRFLSFLEDLLMGNVANKGGGDCVEIWVLRQQATIGE